MHTYCTNKSIKHSFQYINVRKAECDDVLQPEPLRGKKCCIVIVIYLPFKHEQFHMILFKCMQKCPP